MPFLSPKRKVSDAENKLRVLLCLDRLGMATQEQLWPFVAQLELMEYVPFCMFVDELLSGGAIASGTHALQGSLFLTAKGHQQLELFSSRIVHADKERIAAEAPEYARRLSDTREVHAAYELAQDGEYRAFGTVCEGDVPTMLLQARSRNGRTIERFVQQFPSLASQMLARLYMLPLTFTDEPLPAAVTQEEALKNVQPGAPALCAYGGREHAAVLRLDSDKLHFVLLLLFPTAEMAWSWAQTASARSSELADAFAALLEDQP